MKDKTLNSLNVADTVRKRVEQGGERLWRLSDFKGLSCAAVARTLSRLSHSAALKRVSKGVYYRARPTAVGMSQPDPAAISNLARERNKMFPSGISAANLLGFTTQNPGRTEIATTSQSLPLKLLGPHVRVHPKRPPAWNSLSETEAAVLDFLRQRGRTSDLSEEETIQRLLSILSDRDCYEHLLKVSKTEPPRVRAMLGAIGEQLGAEQSDLRRLKQSLNPLSRFDFGVLAGLVHAGQWQAKGWN